MEAYIGWFLFGVGLVLMIVYILMYLLDSFPDIDQGNP
jgi:hypothetical protein